MNAKSLISLGLFLGIGVAVSSCVSAPLGGTKQVETTLSIRAGKRTEAVTAWFLHPDCTFSSYPYVGLIEPSSHGKVDIVHGTVTPHFLNNTQMYMCNRKQVGGAIIYYTPDAGFTGNDQFTVRITGLRDGNGVRDHSVKIRVN
ncbi:Ig-like domain-containing protein [Rhizobium sp. RCC_161_2]|uniref:Ig-like domain-containing protein n=1 Tax=Rhizobium sp. RCC_161_2 TaxID=3239219 RepID=UPI003525102C